MVPHGSVLASQQGPRCRFQLEELGWTIGHCPKDCGGSLEPLKARHLVTLQRAKPNQDLALANRQSRERVGRRFGHEHRLDPYAFASQQWNRASLELRDDGRIGGLTELMNTGNYRYRRSILADSRSILADSRPIRHAETKARVRPRRLEQTNIADVEHCAVCSRFMFCPDRPAIEAFQRCVTALHIGESANPDEPIRPSPIAKLADNRHPDRLLRFDEVPIEQRDHRVALPGFLRVLTEFEDGTALVLSRAS